MITPSTSILLRSSRLAVEIAPPGTIYRRTRFDWSSFVTQVTLNGGQQHKGHTFCVPEDPDPAKGTGGIGLCCEFGHEKCIGYAEAQPGECFPKPGIGLLERTKAPDYTLFRDHRVVQPFSIHVESGPDFARFHVEPLNCRGYAFRQARTLRVKDSRLEIQVEFENCGSRAIHTHEYCHNFTGIDGHPMGPDYRLRFAYPVEFERITPIVRKMLPWPLVRKIMPDFMLDLVIKRMMKSDILTVNESEITWQGVPDRPFLARLSSCSPSEHPQWDLVHEPSGVGMRETCDFAPARVMLWGTTHVVSAEIYVDIDLEPGQSQTWTRQYEFYDRGMEGFPPHQGLDS